MVVSVCGLFALLIDRIGDSDGGPDSTARPGSTADVALVMAYSPEKAELFEELVSEFNASRPRLADKRSVEVLAVAAEPKRMIAGALANEYAAVSPDSSIWLGELDRNWRERQGVDTDLIADTTRYMVSPVVIGMWRSVAESLGYPDRELGWADLANTALEDPAFKWSHPSTQTASGLLATLAQFYTGAGVTRGLTEAMAMDQATLDYVASIEGTVKHYGEGELAVMERIREAGRSYLDAFVVQEQMVVRYNAEAGFKDDLVAIYPVEGTLWEDHPLGLVEHPDRTDDERVAYQMFKEYLLTPETQRSILRHGYRPTDLSIPLDDPESPISPSNGADPSKPYTTLQIPSASVIAVVKDVWWQTKRQSNVYLVVDVSGSMDGRKLADAKDALRSYLAQVQGAEERVGLIAFGNSANVIHDLRQVGQEGVRQDLDVSIDNLEARGNTALLDGVDLALVRLQDLADTARINAILVMTDGKENRSRIELNELVAKLERSATEGAGVRVVVFCIAYGGDADLGMLEAISDPTGGFTRRSDPETIEALYETLSTYF